MSNTINNNMELNVIEKHQLYNSLKDIYCIYLRKSRKDEEAELHGEGDTLKRHEQILLTLAKSMNISIGKIYREIVSRRQYCCKTSYARVVKRR